jgi:hypothetical protein
VDLPATDSIASPLVDAPLSEEVVAASQPYVGRWNKLVSTTNWEKGRIIVEWRESLIAQGLPLSEYSDEAWSRLVGSVTGQHAGRLRRVWQRFGKVKDEYRGLFWSHFQSALDYQDAEMWLEGAVQSGWSVAQMREKRWETLGKVAADRPRAEDVVASETDEDVDLARADKPLTDSLTGEFAEVSGPRHDGPDFGDDESRSARGDSSTLAPGERGTGGEEEIGEPVELVRPFENLPDLPNDLAEAFDTFKLAILHHKTDGWSQIAAGDVLHALDALKALVTAPSDDAPVGIMVRIVLPALHEGRRSRL